MKLVGLLDSPYVRRVAISLQLLDVRFEHQPLSVFAGFEAFRAINPVVKAPTLVLDEGEMLVDSSLILQYAEAIAGSGRSLMPPDLAGQRQALRIIGLALTANEKSVQLVYERKLRPADKQHAPWIDRVTGQLLAAYDALDAAFRDAPRPSQSQTIDQAGITTAVAWMFSRMMVPDVIAATAYPSLQNFSERAEALLEFKAAPFGSTAYRHPDGAAT